MNDVKQLSQASYVFSVLQENRPSGLHSHLLEIHSVDPHPTFTASSPTCRRHERVKMWLHDHSDGMLLGAGPHASGGHIVAACGHVSTARNRINGNNFHGLHEEWKYASGGK